MFDAWWGILPPFEAEDDWFDIQVGDRPKARYSNKTYPSYRVELPELYTKNDLDKKYKEGVKAGKTEADGAYEKGYAAGKADTQKKVDEAYNRGYEDATKNTGTYGCEYTDAELITAFLRTIWNAEGETFDYARDLYCGRHPSADPDEVCIEDIMEDIINSNESLVDMAGEYEYWTLTYFDDIKPKAESFDLVLAPDGSKVFINEVRDGKYVGFDLDHNKKVSGDLSTVKKIGRMKSEKD